MSALNFHFRPLALGLTMAWFCFPAHAETPQSNTTTNVNLNSYVSGVSTVTTDSVDASTYLYTPVVNKDIWKYKGKFLLGFSTGTLDQKRRFGGEISSRWGVSITSGRNIYLHRGPIGGFLKFGLNIDMNINYLNFAKGSGKLSNFGNIDAGEEGVEPTSLGRHYLTAGIALGPTATFAPFYSSHNRNLALLVFRPYFHVAPSYATYIISENEETELHNAFALWFAAGMEIQWKRLIIGLEWKGSTAKYKGILESIVSDLEDGSESKRSHKFDMNMINVSIGFAF